VRHGELFGPCDGRNRKEAEEAAAATAWMILTPRDPQ